MVNPGTFRGLRLEFLNSQNDGYAAAAESGDLDAFIQNTQRRYFKRFPITLDHSADPTQEWLDQVDDDAPDADLDAPNADAMAADEYGPAVEAYEALVQALKKRKESIKRRLQYRYLKTRGSDDGTATGKGATNSLAILTAKLMGKPPTKPRLKTPYNVWGPQHRAIVDPIFTARVKEGKVPASQQLALRSTVYKELFEELSAEEKKEWADRAEEEHQTALVEYKLAMTGPPSTKPQDRQRVITAVPRLVAPILDLISAYTGWQWSLMGGGPEPADDGRLNMLSIHSGTMPGTVRMDFGRAERQAYREYIQPAFGRYLTRCYTVEECRSRALPRNHVETPLAAVAEEEDFDHRHFDRNESVKLATSKVPHNTGQGSKDTRAAGATKGSRSTNPDTKDSRSSHAGSQETRHSNSHVPASNPLRNDNVAPNPVKYGPPRGKKATRVPPVGEKNRGLGALAGEEAVAGGSRKGTAHSVAHKVASTSRSASDPVARTAAVHASNLAPATRSASQPVATPAGSSSTSTSKSIPWKSRPTSAKSMSMAPSRAGSQAPSLGRTPSPSGTPAFLASRHGSPATFSRPLSRAPSPPPSRAPSPPPSRVPSPPLSRAPSPPPSSAFAHVASPAVVGPTTPATSALQETAAATAAGAALVPAAPPAALSPPSAMATTSTSMTTATTMSPTAVTSTSATTTSATAATTTTTTSATATTSTKSTSATATKSTSATATTSTSATATTSTSATATTSTSAAVRRIPSGATAVPDNDALEEMVSAASKKRKGGRAGGAAAASKESSGSKRKAPTEEPGARKKKRGVGGEAVMPSAFEVPRPSDCPGWIEDAVQLLAAEDLGPQWRALISAWLKFEEVYGFAKAGSTLPATHRPAAVSDWIRRARRPNYRPTLGSLQNYENAFWEWWSALQPEWRTDRDNDGSGNEEDNNGDSRALKCTEGGDWEVLRVPGQNGILSIIAGLCFWGISAAGSSNDVARWSLALQDVHYALTQLI